MYKNTVERIILGNDHFCSFWGDSGWANIEAAELLSKSRLDWQVELSKTLLIWDFKEPPTSGELILAWVNLGVLVEGSLKLFLCVHYSDYLKSEYRIQNKNKNMPPDGLSLENLKCFFKKENILKEEWIDYINNIQNKRNAIHAFKDRTIGTKEEFENAVDKYLELMLLLKGSMPAPFIMIF